MANITIDGTPIEIQDGSTVLQAAKAHGIHIPTLCDHPELTPYGGCRLCLVEVDGFRVPQPACTLPVANGMNIRTKSEAIDASRKFVLSMIFSERNHFCPYCQVSGGDCELQNAAYDEGMTHWPIQPGWNTFPLDASHEYMIFEHQRCILCRRCVRACAELPGNFTLGVENRGARSMVMADSGLPWGESSCVSCGSCLQVCPTGAIMDRWSSYRGREEESPIVKTICKKCSIGCGLDVYIRDNNLVKIYGDWDWPVNQGVICDQGRFQPIAEQRKRLTQAFHTVDGKPQACDLDAAINSLSAFIQEHKPYGLISDGLSKESIDGLVGLLGMDKVASLDLSSSLLQEMQAELAGIERAKLNDLHDCDTVLIIEDDLQSDHQVAGFFIKRRLSKGLNLITIASETSDFSELANDFILAKPNDIAGVLQSLNTDSVHPNIRKAAQILQNSQSIVVVAGKSLNQTALKAVALLSNKYKAKVLFTLGGANSAYTAQAGLEKVLPIEQADAMIVVLGDDKLSELQSQILAAIPHLAVLASYQSPLTDQAELVIPVTNWAEESGTYVNVDGTVQHSQAALLAGDIQPTADILSSLFVEKTAN